MAVEFEVSPEGVRNYRHQKSCSVSLPYPSLYDFRSQDGKVIEQMAVCPEYGPEVVGHGQHHMGVWNLGQVAPALSEPLEIVALTTAGAHP